jgi:hypothetical protein
MNLPHDRSRNRCRVDQELVQGDFIGRWGRVRKETEPVINPSPDNPLITAQIEIINEVRAENRENRFPEVVANQLRSFLVWIIRR